MERNEYIYKQETNNQLWRQGKRPSEARVRRKIADWYTKLEYEDKAVARLAAQRDEIINLLQSTGREGIFKK